MEITKAPRRRRCEALREGAIREGSEFGLISLMYARWMSSSSTHLMPKCLCLVLVTLGVTCSSTANGVMKKRNYEVVILSVSAGIGSSLFARWRWMTLGGT